MNRFLNLCHSGRSRCAVLTPLCHTERSRSASLSHLYFTEDVGGLKSDDRSRMTEVRGKMSEVRSEDEAHMEQPSLVLRLTSLLRNHETISNESVSIHRILTN